MIVCKFGGSATASKKAIENVKSLKNDDRTVWVFSAIGKTSKNDTKLTDLLISYTRQNSKKNIIKQKIIAKFAQLCLITNVKMDISKIVDDACKTFEQQKDKDWFVARGEYLTTQIMANYLGLKFVPAEQILFLKNGKINFEKTEKAIRKQILTGQSIAVPGFYALNQTNNQQALKLFSRGGSDYTACIIAKCIGASICENWKDVDGIYPINPNLKKSEILPKLSYTDLNIMAKMDAKVIHKNCASLLNGTGTVLQVKNILKPQISGTQVSSTCKSNAEFLVFKRNKTNCHLIQGLKDGSRICLTLPANCLKKGVECLSKLKNQL